MAETIVNHIHRIPGKVRRAVVQKMEALAGNEALRDAETFQWRMEELAQHYVVSAFRRLGWEPAMGQLVTTNELMWGLGVKERYRKLVDHLLVGLAEKVGDQWHMFHSFDSREEQLHKALNAEFPQAYYEIGLLERCGRQLPSVLTGDLDPLNLLFPKDESLSVKQLYSQSPVALYCNGLLAESVKTIADSQSMNRRFRILEIGAGTGGAAGAILPVLAPDKTEYSFTDLSVAFFEDASLRFKEYDFVSFSSLDIEKDPLAQGFDLHSYDLVVAANVLHSTKDLTLVLKHVKQLLRSEGLLVLQETTHQKVWLDLTFGLLMGWWKFDDSVRTDYPLISPNKWSNLLKAQGYSDVSVVIPHRIHGQAILIAM